MAEELLLDLMYSDAIFKMYLTNLKSHAFLPCIE